MHFRIIYISYTKALRCIWVGMIDIYSVASYRYFGGTFRMALLAFGCYCLNADDFIEYSCPDYSICPKCKENCPPPKKKRLSLPYLGRDITGFKKPMQYIAS